MENENTSENQNFRMKKKKKKKQKKRKRKKEVYRYNWDFFYVNEMFFEVQVQIFLQVIIIQAFLSIFLSFCLLMS